MARYARAVCELCRRKGQEFFLKGERCYTDKYGVGRRAYAPGQHGQGRKKTSECDLQLHAKQMTGRFYGVLESQFRDYYDMVTRMEGKTGDLLLGILESRLSDVVYRLGWSSSHAEARQLIVHGHFTINGKRVGIPSYPTKPGEVISVKGSSHNSGKIKAVLGTNASRPVPKWVKLNRNTFEAKVLTFLGRKDIELAAGETFIVELYSR